MSTLSGEPGAKPPVWPEAYRLVELASVESTMDEARARAQAGDAGALWIRTDEQTAGRGRRGRRWLSNAGNLMATLLLRPSVTPAVGAQLSYVAALALGDVVAGALPNRTISLKWPNDIRIAGAKIAGILLESSARTDGQVAWISIGLGLNMTSHPPDPAYPTTSLQAEGQDRVPTPGEALAALAVSMDHWLGVWQDGAGFARIREAWLDRAEGLGRALEARLAHETVRGVFDGLDDEGGLVLRLADGNRRVIHGGEVAFPDSGIRDGAGHPSPKGD